nr:hypothetical protein [Candidatus Microthrix sp.]
MTFIGLVWHNVSARRMRAALTAGAVAIGVMAVVALGTLPSSLEQSATGFLESGQRRLHHRPEAHRQPAELADLQRRHRLHRQG